MEKLSFYWLFVFTILLIGCNKDDDVGPDLSTEMISFTKPLPGTVTSDTLIAFRWEAILGTTHYKFEIASPDFQQSDPLIANLTLDTAGANYQLSPGSYQWRVRAFNHSSSTIYSTASITVDTTDISDQVAVLISPEPGFASNSLSQTFEWKQVPFAENHRFELSAPDFTGTEVILPEISPATSFTHVFSSEGNYQWRVRGEKGNSFTQYTTYSLEIDITAPDVPVLTSPGDNESIPGTSVTFYWDRGNVTGSAITDSLWIASDDQFNNIVVEARILNTSYTSNFTSGTYYWKVRSFDVAGNISDYSSARKFSVQ